MKFSICIPNYNYEKYIGRTIQSVLDSTDDDFEIVVSDNASTDGSIEVINGFEDKRIHLHQNQCNVGFSGNLDRAGRMATGDVMIMLSSDDLIRPQALEAYKRIYEAIGDEADHAIVTSAVDMIDPDDRVTDYLGPDPELFFDSDLVNHVPVPDGVKVYRVEGSELLRRSLKAMRNPFHFAATSYSRSLYEKVEGYGGGRQINPDKWYHWQMLGAGAVSYFIDTSLFAYRWHPNNQVAKQTSAGALKYLSDEYVSTFELDKQVLEKIGLSRTFVEKAFVERDIGRHGLATLAQGDRQKAARILDFGRATYPQHTRSNAKTLALRSLLALGPISTPVAKLAYRMSGLQSS
jgi:glycosyltransferase involved in cell wall biosynthesis